MLQELYTFIVTTIVPLLAWLLTRPGRIALLFVVGACTIATMKAANTGAKARRALPQVMVLSAIMVLLLIASR